MADTKLSALTAATTASDDDLLYVVDDPAGTPASKKITVANFITSIQGTGAGDCAAGNHTHAGVYEPADAAIQSHLANTSNPHTVTKAQVGLTNVTDNAQLKIASNLSDVANAATSRTNLGLGGAAVLAVGTTAGTVAAGDHNHTGVYEPANANLLETTDIGTSVQAYDADLPIQSVTFIIDGGGSAITTGVKGFIEVPFACTIQRVTTLADQSGSIVVDIWKDTYANYPPTVADTITASAKPTLSSATKAQDSTLTGWTTSVAAGDILGFNVDSATTVTRVTIALKVTK